MKTFCFLSLAFCVLMILAVPTQSSDSLTDVSAYAYGSEWTEYTYDPSWPGGLNDPWCPTTYQEAVGGVYASSNIFGSYKASANVSGETSRIPLTYYGAGIDTSASVTRSHAWKTSSECGGSGGANSSISGASAGGGTDSDSDSWFGYF